MSEFTFDLDKPLEPAVSDDVCNTTTPVQEATKPVRGSMESQYARIAEFFREPEPFRTLQYEAGLLQIPDFDWCHGSWTVMREEGGWRDELNGKQFVSVEHVRDAIERRIRELGLDRELIDTYKAPRPYQEPTVANCGAALRRLINEQSWERLPFEQRMNRFRRGMQ
jgi:hypothetical protein